MTIGQNIKRLRRNADMTQEELADRAELSKGFISQLERDLTSPSITTLIDLLQVLGTTPKDFFDDESENQIVFHKQDRQEGRFLHEAQPLDMAMPCLYPYGSNKRTLRQIPHTRSKAA